jgi:hypothetical protein
MRFNYPRVLPVLDGGGRAIHCSILPSTTRLRGTNFRPPLFSYSWQFQKYYICKIINKIRNKWFLLFNVSVIASRTAPRAISFACYEYARVYRLLICAPFGNSAYRRYQVAARRSLVHKLSTRPLTPSLWWDPATIHYGVFKVNS